MKLDYHSMQPSPQPFRLLALCLQQDVSTQSTEKKWQMKNKVL
jgi:hypothetical protein